MPPQPPTDPTKPAPEIFKHELKLMPTDPNLKPEDTLPPPANPAADQPVAAPALPAPAPTPTAAPATPAIAVPPAAVPLAPPAQASAPAPAETPPITIIKTPWLKIAGLGLGVSLAVGA